MQSTVHLQNGKPARSMWLDLFRDKARVNADGESICVTFTHWAQRSKNFLFDLQCVRAVEAVQIEPASMQLTFVLEDGLRRDISEEMAGWNEVLAFVQSRFTGFDRDAYERAKGDVSRVCLCWSKPRSTPSATAAR